MVLKLSDGAYIVEKLLFLVFVGGIFFFIYLVQRKAVITKREKLIKGFCFPKTITEKVHERYPHLSEEQLNSVLDALRDYFSICNIAGKRMVAMPSQVVDIAWHEFILFTRQYQLFCKEALGRFLHHTPAEAMQSQTHAQNGIKIAWKIACRKESIEPKSPHKLPLLFAIDARLKIPDGFNYSLNCKPLRNDHYCASHIGCRSGCGSGCGGDSSGCGGGCGGGD